MTVYQDDPEFVALTLQWCNERRAERSMEPLDRLPKGRRCAPLSCPCGAATGLWVHYYDARDGADYSIKAATTSPAVKAFIRAFDAGTLPQYDEDKP